VKGLCQVVSPTAGKFLAAARERFGWNAELGRVSIANPAPPAIFKVPSVDPPLDRFEEIPRVQAIHMKPLAMAQRAQ
jgi:hypothetical protein